MAYQEFLTIDEAITLKLLYRRVFGTPDGKRVLAHVLTELGFFDTAVQDEREMGRQDYARRLLWLIGVTDEQNIMGIVDGLLNQPLRTGGADEGDEQEE